MADDVSGNRPDKRQRAAMIAALSIAFAAVLFTVGFFTGRGTGGTEVRVYLQNTEGVYMAPPAESPPETSQAPILRVQPAEPAQTSTAGRAVPETTALLRLIEDEKPAASSSDALPKESDMPDETSVSETAQASESTSTETETTKQTTTAAKSTTLGIININSATQSQLESLPGIGPVKAAAIIDYRKQHGPFSSVEDLVKVSGIGEKTLNNIRSHITVG